jgi:hypothetical protein
VRTKVSSVPGERLLVDSWVSDLNLILLLHYTIFSHSTLLAVTTRACSKASLVNSSQAKPSTPTYIAIIIVLIRNYYYSLCPKISDSVFNVSRRISMCRYILEKVESLIWDGRSNILSGYYVLHTKLTAEKKGTATNLITFAPKQPNLFEGTATNASG